MATASGNKVGISKRRQNDNEEGELKRSTAVTKKASTQDASQSSSKGNENDKVNPRKKRLFNACFLQTFFVADPFSNDITLRRRGQ